MNLLGSSETKKWALATILRLWKITGALSMAVLIFNKLYIAPQFLTLCIARNEFLRFVLSLVITLQNQIPIKDKSKFTQHVLKNRDKDNIGSIAEIKYIDAQTQTGDFDIIGDIDKTLVEANEEDSQYQNNDKINSDMIEPESSKRIKTLMEKVELFNLAVINKSFTITNYSANELNILIENLLYARSTATLKPVVADKTSQAKGLAHHLRDEIRRLKSEALKI
ncbi:hypothetical protein V1511DRAFT_495484 [Dipodascopsis uninucleata]